jgi:predicted dienelactone hydrolase
MFVALIAVVWMFAVPADAQSFRAGLTRLTVQDATPFDALIVYPSQAPEVSLAEGLMTLSASRDSPVAGGARFPVVLFSHGNGRGGTPLMHRDLLLHLARNGFIVIAPFHAGPDRPFVNRPRQIRRALETALSDPRFAPHADAERIGMMGFSFGGAVSLIVAGAKTNLAHLQVYCRDHRDDPRACDGIPTDDSWAGVPSVTSEDARRLKALVLMEPLGAVFGRDDLKSLDMPVLIYRALQTDLRAEGNALAVGQTLPRQPQQVAVSGGHLVFIDPCPPALQAEVPQACNDAPGVDRVAIHQQLRREIADFFRANL